MLSQLSKSQQLDRSHVSVVRCGQAVDELLRLMKLSTRLQSDNSAGDQNNLSITTEKLPRFHQNYGSTRVFET